MVEGRSPMHLESQVSPTWRGEVGTEKWNVEGQPSMQASTGPSR